MHWFWAVISLFIFMHNVSVSGSAAGITNHTNEWSGTHKLLFLYYTMDVHSHNKFCLKIARIWRMLALNRSCMCGCLCLHEQQSNYHYNLEIFSMFVVKCKTMVKENYIPFGCMPFICQMRGLFLKWSNLENIEVETFYWMSWKCCIRIHVMVLTFALVNIKKWSSLQNCNINLNFAILCLKRVSSFCFLVEEASSASFCGILFWYAYKSVLQSLKHSKITHMQIYY